MENVSGRIKFKMFLGTFGSNFSKWILEKSFLLSQRTDRAMRLFMSTIELPGDVNRGRANFGWLWFQY